MRRLAFLLLPALLGCHRPPSEHSEWLPARPAPELEGLEVTSNAPFKLSQHRGKAQLVAFGFTSCVEICPRTLSKLHRVYEELGPDADRLEAVYVSIDPKRDTPEHFKAYLAKFDERIDGLSMSEAALPGALESFGATAKKTGNEVRRYVGNSEDAQRGYSFIHSAASWLIDPSGNERVRFEGAAEGPEIASVVRKVLNDSPN